MRTKHMTIPPERHVTREAVSRRKTGVLLTKKRGRAAGQVETTDSAIGLLREHGYQTESSHGFVNLFVHINS